MASAQAGDIGPSARRALVAILLAALGAAGAASAGAIGSSGPGASGTACASSTASAASTTIPTTTATSMTYTAPVACTTVPATTSKTTAPATTTAPTVTTSASASTLVLTGHGWGHGIGMGQWGAYGYARHGWSWERILAHYYVGTTIGVGPAPEVRVLLLDGKRSVALSSSTPWLVVDANGTKLGLPAGKLVVPASLSVAGYALVSPLTFVPGADPLRVGKLPYRGNLLVVSNGKRLQVIDAVGIESYLDGVVGAEVPQTWPAAALEAQAVAARSYALAQIESVVTAAPYDLFADTRSQVYGGVDAESPAVTAAVAATAGKIVLYDGKVATTYFSSSTGGQTVSAAEALGTPIPYLVSVPDPYDTLSPDHDWGPVLMNAAAAGKALGLAGPLVDLQTVAGPSGHVATAVASDGTGGKTLTGSEVRDDLGLRSSWFEVGWLTLTPPPAPIPFGSSLTLSGEVRGLTGVSLEAKTAQTGWQPVATVKAGAAGTFTVAVRPQVTTRYRLSSGLVRAALIEVPVAPIVQAAAGQAGVGGSVKPALMGAPVALQRQDGARWTTVATGVTGSDGSFEIQATLSPGAYRVRCTPGHGLAPGVSPLLAAS
jgi:SpoIID/LytB domain protein